MPLPRNVRDLLLRQFGAVARSQLRDCMTAPQVDGLVQREALEVIHRGVYRVRGGAVTPEQSAMAAVLRVRVARVAGPFVMGLFGAEGFSRADPFVVLVPPGTWPRGVSFPVSTDPCPGQHGATWDTCLPVVTPTMACIDLAHPRRGVSDRQLRVAVDSLRWAGRTSTGRLDRAAAALPTHRGARRIRRLLDDLTLVSESEKERVLAAVLDALGLPVERQAWIGGHRVDFLLRLLKLIIEYDGEVHDRPERRAADDNRDDSLEADGYLVVHVRAADLADPERLERRLRDIIRRRAAELGVALDTRL